MIRREPQASTRSFAQSVWLTAVLFALSSPVDAAQRSEDSTPQRQLLWGDTHLHTYFSPDASLNGNTRIGPREAYSFARGDTVQAHNGQSARLKRPLDFLVIADHAEYLGLLSRIRSQDPSVMVHTVTSRWSRMINSGDEEQTWQAMFEVLDDIETNQPRFTDDSILRSTWASQIRIAEEFNEPGRFTTLIGFEWTSMPGGNNLHRVVLFKDGAEVLGDTLPFSAFDSEDPADLWAYLENYTQRTGGEALAIAHNGNMSNGVMFPLAKADGKPLDTTYAVSRQRWEPLYEVTQIKGDGETHPLLSPNDEYADFENWDKGNLTASAGKEVWMLQHEYARSALRMGLQIESQTGVNPYRFGMIGSSDAHTGLAGVSEDNFWGKFSVYEPGLHRLVHQPVVAGKLEKAYDLWAYEMTASGYAAVWAEENTREAIFAALKRKEVYATTGSRIRLRLFGGWEFAKEDAHGRGFAARGYAGGVPMGGVLTARAGGGSPTFILRALKDPDGVPLERLQLIKGWLDRSGATHERIHDLAVEVDGAAQLQARWQDPDFDPDQAAFYYARVIEVPRPRWTHDEAIAREVEDRAHLTVSVRDRAYSSPIWYRPN